MSNMSEKSPLAWLLSHAHGFFAVSVLLLAVGIYALNNSDTPFGKTDVLYSCSYSMSSASVPSTALNPGGSQSYPLTITPYHCTAAGTVNLTISSSSAPAGVAATAYPNCTLASSTASVPAATSGAATVTCTAGSSTPAGYYGYKISYTAGTFTSTYYISVNVGSSSTTTPTTCAAGYTYLSCPASGTAAAWSSCVVTGTTCTSSTTTTGGMATCTSTAGAVRTAQNSCTSVESISCPVGYVNCVSGIGDKYCNSGTTCPSTTTPTTCPSGQTYMSCPASGTAAAWSKCVTSGTTCTTTTGGATGSAKACANGERCVTGSWCSNGQQFYYSNGDLTCVAWSIDGSQPAAPTGTSECKPTDTSCVGSGQIVPYVSGKWCSRGMSYYSTDGKNMTCVLMSGGSPATAPAGFTSCRPDDKNCIPENGYGPSTGWCSNGMKFYQTAEDGNPNNNVYCAPYKPMPPMVPGTYPPAGVDNTPTPPTGYSVCDPTNKFCHQKGDTWTDTGTSNYCTNGQKCSTATGGSCVGWNESCPVGTKFCDASSPTCVEPGEKRLLSSSTSGYSSFWCGGGGMTFYSKTEVYCAPKKSGTGTATYMMFTAQDVKDILAKLGSGWGLCRPQYASATSTTYSSQCIEPGQTGPSNGWCGWYPPMVGPMPMPMPYSTSPSSSSIPTRTCPGLDGDTTPPPPPPPPPPQPPGPPPKPDMCPKMPDFAGCPVGQILKRWTNADGCSGTYCESERPNRCPVYSQRPQCGPYDIINEFVTPEGCKMIQCVPKPGDPKPNFDMCRNLREQNRSYKHEIRGFKQNMKYLPNEVTVPEDIKNLLQKAEESYEEIESTLKVIKGNEVCTPEFVQSIDQKLSALNKLMMELREKIRNIQVYGDCARMTREMDDRVKMLERDANRIGRGKVNFDDEIAAFKALQTKSKEICKVADRYAFEDLQQERVELEHRVQDKFNKLADQGRDNYIKDIIASIRDGIREGRAKLTANGDKNKEQCTKVSGLFDQVAGLLDKAESEYKNGKIDEARVILDKVERFKEPVMEAAKQCGIKFEIEDRGDLRQVFSNIENIVEETVNRVVSNAFLKLQSVLDERFKQISANLAKVAEAFQKNIQDSLVALQALPKTVEAEKVKDTKNVLVDAVANAKETAAQLSVANARRLNSALEKAAKINWCGKLADAIAGQAKAFKAKSTNNDLTVEDVDGFEKSVNTSEGQNMEECYKVGVSRFRDMDTAAWYYAHLQNNPFFRGLMDDKGNLTGEVKPGSQTLRAEALIAIERARGLNGIEGKCELKAKAQGVPEWANCAVNVAAENGLKFFGPFDQPAARDEVASWVMTLAKKDLPAGGDPSYLRDFRDIGKCKAQTEVSAMVANKIMTGFTGENAGNWGCGQSLVRAELGAILNRLAELMTLVK